MPASDSESELKQARVTEEIVISKEAVQGTERVSDTVRKEEVFVDEKGVIDASLGEGKESGSHPTI